LIIIKVTVKDGMQEPFDSPKRYPTISTSEHCDCNNKFQSMRMYACMSTFNYLASIKNSISGGKKKMVAMLPTSTHGFGTLWITDALKANTHTGKPHSHCHSFQSIFKIFNQNILIRNI
jgi:hypothetical protein